VGVGCRAVETVVVFWPESSAVSDALRAWSALRSHGAACGECDTACIATTLLDDRRN